MEKKGKDDDLLSNSLSMQVKIVKEGEYTVSITRRRKGREIRVRRQDDLHQ